MKAKLTLQERWFIFMGKKYKVNHRSMEIHSLVRKHVNCLPQRKETTEFVKESKVVKLLNGGYNGCRWCMKEEDTDCLLQAKSSVV